MKHATAPTYVPSSLKSDFANLLEVAVKPRLRAGEELRSTRAAAPRRLPNSRKTPSLRPARPFRAPLLRDQNVTNGFRQQTGQRV